jgi:hypothetical protein
MNDAFLPLTNVNIVHIVRAYVSANGSFAVFYSLHIFVLCSQFVSSFNQYNTIFDKHVLQCCHVNRILLICDVYVKHVCFIPNPLFLRNII